MADVYGNPYLPSFVRNQPKMSNPVAMPTTPILPTKATQITSVQGFAGARQHVATLTPGSSEIVADSDPNLARIYMVVVDQNNQQYVQGFDLVAVEEPKQITMDDLNDKMNKVLTRLDQLEQERTIVNDQPSNVATAKSEPANVISTTSAWNAKGSERSGSCSVSNGTN